METKSFRLALIILAAAFAVFSILVFAIAGFAGHGATFWVAYVMTVIAYALCAAAIYMCFKKGTLFEKLFYGFPIIKWSVVYAGAATLVAVICMLVPGITRVVPFVAVFVLSVAYVIIVAGALVGKNEAARIDAETKQNAQSILLLRAEVNAAANETGDAQLKKRLFELSEAVRYSDPVSAQALLPLEELISNKVAQIRAAIGENDAENALRLIADAENMLKERNEKTRALKG